MAICERAASFEALELPPELEDLEGLLQADLQAIVAMVTTRAHERLFLTRREFAELQQKLWNGLVGVLNEAVEPISVETR